MMQARPQGCKAKHRSPWIARLVAVLPAIVSLCMAGPAAAQPAASGCAFAPGGYEHADYRSQRSGLAVVERRHFTAKVERLVSGESTSTPGPDLDYTLNKFPNHHRALLAVSRLGQKLGVAQVPDMPVSVDCYFLRAIQFQPTDTVARMLYAQHLGQTRRPEEASKQLDLTAKYADDNPLTHYNIAWVALELKDYDRALKHAHIAYGAGIDRPELRDLLVRAGKWTEPAAPATTSAPSPATSAASASAEAASR